MSYSNPEKVVFMEDVDGAVSKHFQELFETTCRDAAGKIIQAFYHA